MEAVRDMTGHWSSASVHFEDFGTRKPAATEDDKPFIVRLSATGEAVPIPAGVSILEALRTNGHHVPTPVKAAPAARAWWKARRSIATWCCPKPSARTTSWCASHAPTRRNW